ncbi:hypothetical protein ACQKCU_22285 [Heyndrickxia sporothermodurans]
MDVKYTPSDWEKMKDGIGDLIGLGRWGKGMIDDLKDITDNLEDAESDIASYDSDGVISFHHSSQKDKFQQLYEDFEVLHRFTGKVGDIVDRTIDQPFYEDIDAFVEAMRDLTISNYTTKNRVGATEVKVTYAGYGQQQTLEVPKTEVNIDDLFNGDNYYGEQIRLEYEAWKELNPDQDFSQKEYQIAAVNTHAFEYESIHDQQESKEFWGQIAALVVIVGATLICPPAGMALGAVYGTFELSSAVSGKDWISGRELGTGERVFRGLLSPLDIIPGVSSVTKFSGAVKIAHIKDVGKFTIKSGIKGSIKDGVAPIKNIVETAGKMSATRIKSAVSVAKDVSNKLKNKLIDDTIEIGRFVDSAITHGKNIIPTRSKGLVADGFGNIDNFRGPVENTHTVENKLKAMLSKMDGVNVGGKGSGENTFKLGKTDLDVYRNELNVPETNTVSVGKADVSGLENLVFKGASPEVRNQAKLPSLDDVNPNREFKAPYNHIKNPRLAQFTRHAEEGVLNEFNDAVKKAGIDPNDVKGTLYIHQSNPRGVCNKCTKGLIKPFPEDKCGIFYQASKKFPNLKIVVTSEIDETVKVNGLLSFTLKDGKIL